MTHEEAYRAGYQAGTLSKPEIVRCKDCKYCFAEGFVHEHNICDKHEGIQGQPDDWFCADGEKGETEIIRCKDCKHFVIEDQVCKYHEVYYVLVKPDNYCTHGERR